MIIPEAAGRAVADELAPLPLALRRLPPHLSDQPVSAAGQAGTITIKPRARQGHPRDATAYHR